MKRLFKIIPAFSLVFLLAGCTEKGPAAKLTNPGNSWYKPPLLAVMTGFIYYPKSSYSISEWEKNLGSEFDAMKFVGELKDANVDYLIFYDKWIDGFVFHNTKTTNFKTSRDFFADVSKACDEKGVHLVVYYNAVSDGNPEFSDGFARDYFGNRFPFSPGWPTSRSTLHYPEFRAKSLEQFTEIVSSYGKIGGIWFDIFSEVGDARNKCIIEAAESRYGKPLSEITAEEFNIFLQETMGAYVKDARQIADKFQENTVFTENGSVTSMGGNPVRLREIDQMMDYWMMETNTTESTDFNSWRAHFSPKPVEMGSLISKDWFAVKDSMAPGLRSGSMGDVIAETALSVCRGASIYLAITPGYKGDMGAGVDAVKAAGGWYGKVKPILNNASLYGNIGIVLGTPAPDGKGLPVRNSFWTKPGKAVSGALNEALSLCEDISDAGYCPKVLYSYSDFTTWPGSLRELKAIILPEMAVLDGNHIRKLAEYVNDGGTLISFAHAGMLNENGERLADQALRELYGIQVKAGNEKEGGIMVFSNAAKDFFTDLPPVSGNILVPEYDSSSVIPLANVGDYPVIFQKINGKGKTIYVAASESEFRGKSFWAGLLMMNGIKPAVVISNNESVKGFYPKNINRYASVIKTTSQGKVIHIIDRKGGSGEINIEVDPAILGDASSATLVETGAALEITRKGDRSFINALCSPVSSILIK